MEGILEPIIIKAIEGFPSFAGLIICIVILRQENIRLMSLLERFCKPCDEKDTE